MNYCIYLHTNKLNHKVYIGQTCQKPERRWGLNGSGYKGSPYFYNAIQKYGWDNFLHEILKLHLTRLEANYWEKYYILQYQATDQKYGYNIKLGGYYAPDNHREVICLNTKEIFYSISDAAEKYLNDKNKNSHIVSVCKGDRSHAGQLNGEYLVWAYLDEYLDFPEKFQNFSVKKKGHTDRKIICVTTGQIFDKIQDAVQWCGQKGNANIIKVCKGERKTSGKHPDTGEPLVWQYYNG